MKDSVNPILNDKLRLVRLDSSNIHEVVKVHRQAFHDRLTGRLGNWYARKMLKWFSDRPDGIAMVALYDGAVAGYTVGAPLGYQGEFNRDLSLTAALVILLKPWLWLNPSLLNIICERH